MSFERRKSLQNRVARNENAGVVFFFHSNFRFELYTRKIENGKARRYVIFASLFSSVSQSFFLLFLLRVCAQGFCFPPEQVLFSENYHRAGALSSSTTPRTSYIAKAGSSSCSSSSSSFVEACLVSDCLSL